MSENPYQSPKASGTPTSLASRRRVAMGDVAAMVSAAGFLGLFVFMWEPLRSLLPAVSLLCPVGLTLGIVGFWYGPKRSAIWAILLGFGGTLYLPTIWLFLFRTAQDS